MKNSIQEIKILTVYLLITKNFISPSPSTHVQNLYSANKLKQNLHIKIIFIRIKKKIQDNIHTRNIPGEANIPRGRMEFGGC